MRISLRTRLIASSVMLVVVPVLVLATLSTYALWHFGRDTANRSFTRLEAEARQALQSRAGTERDFMDSFMGRIEADARQLAGSPTLAAYLNPRGNEVFADLASRELKSTVRNIRNRCAATATLLDAKLSSDLKVCAHVLAAHGAVTLTDEAHAWEAKNQLGDDTQSVSLPLLRFGEETLLPNTSADTPTPLVDEVVQIVGGTCTIFQRMNEAGDMLRVATTVRDAQGARAVGTFIPARNADGSATPAIAAALAGQEFRGRSYVVDGWYSTAYAPLRSADGAVVGMIYVGVPEQGVGSFTQGVQQAIAETRFGTDGYLFVMDPQGTLIFHPKAEYIGKNLITDLNVASFKEVLAQKLENEQVLSHDYTFEGRDKFIMYTYFAPWNWMICASGYWDDLMADAKRSLLHCSTDDAEAFAHTSEMTIGGKNRPIYSQVRFLASDGMEIFKIQNGKSNTELKSKANTTWFKEAIQVPQGGLYNSGVAVAENTGQPELRIAAPVYLDGKPQGCIVLNCDWSIVQDVMREHKYGESGYVYMIDAGGTVVLHPKYNLTDKVNLLDAKYGTLASIVRDQMVKGQQAAVEYEFEGQSKYVAFTPVHMGDKAYSLAVGVPVDEPLKLAVELRSEGQKQTTAAIGRTGVAAAVLVVLGALVGMRLAVGMSRPLQRLIHDLDQGARRLEEVAEQMAGANQELAAGATEQASSLEETSGALQEASAMTMANSNTAKQANGLATQAREKADGSGATVTRLNVAMSGVNEASDRIRKIISVIQEIAFQTNLLALNAAVEAARAGEHGKGFAVVAEEVRSLAQRSAEAATETTELIETTLSRVREGTGAASDTAVVLKEIAGDVAQIASLMDTITRAGADQATAVEQINTAIMQMNNVTQQNASSAEQLAAAGEELSSQATSVQSAVTELATMVSGDKR